MVAARTIIGHHALPPGCALTVCVTMRRYMETYAKLVHLLGVVWMRGCVALYLGGEKGQLRNG